ncbi:DUF3800 domain-containing protein [Mobiluncus mulieris]|nr:DUF3800 domain-containing protein [Mobiluncus mulieris]
MSKTLTKTPPPAQTPKKTRHMLRNCGSQQRFDYYCDAVTPGYQGRQLVCIERTIDFVDSREYFGVQSADIVAYLHRRLNGTTGSSKQTQRACQRVYKVLESSIISARKWRP